MFDADLSLNKFYDDSHLVVMRELKEEANSPKAGKQGLGGSLGSLMAAQYCPIRATACSL